MRVNTSSIRHVGFERDACAQNAKLIPYGEKTRFCFQKHLIRSIIHIYNTEYAGIVMTAFQAM